MSELNYTGDTIRNGYVYYKYLFHAKHVGSSTLKEAIRAEKDIELGLMEMQMERENGSSERLLEMAQAEASKERAALTKAFGANLNNFDPMNENCYREITEALNNVLQIKEVYESNLAKIDSRINKRSDVATATYTNITRWFPDSLSTVMSSSQLNYAGLIGERIGNNTTKNNMTIKAATDEAVDYYSPKIINSAIIDMFSRKDFNPKGDTQDDEINRSYQEIANQIQNGMHTAQTNELMRGLSEIYHLNDVFEALKSTISDQVKHNSNVQLKNAIKKGGNGIAGKTLFKSQMQNAGLAAEELAKFQFNVLVQQTMPKVKMGAERIGGDQAKADTIITLNMDVSAVTERLAEIGKQAETENESDSKRQTNIETFRRLYDEIKGVNDGFIIYTSAKDYKLNASHGFEAGSQSLEQFKATYRTFNKRSYSGKNMTTIFGMIANTMTGAVSETEKEQIEEYLALDISQWLFDDVDQIGFTNNRGTNVLHMLYLNGVYVPLSYFLYLFGTALADLEGHPEDVARINITPGTIKWPTEADFLAETERRTESYAIYDPDMRGLAKYGASKQMWKEQRNAALKEVKIKATFMHKFNQFIADFSQSQGKSF